MPQGTTCSICNKPLIVDGERVASYYTVRAEKGGNGEALRSRNQFNLKLCNECLESVLLTPADLADDEFKKAIYKETD